jgi:hypothetical protein
MPGRAWRILQEFVGGGGVGHGSVQW